MLKKNKSLTLILMIVLTFGVIKVTSIANNQKDEKDVSIFWEGIKDAREITEIMGVIEENFYGEEELDKKKLKEGAIRGMVNSLGDPHTNYFTKEDYKKFTEDIQGEYAGVGMFVTKKENVLTVVTPIEDTPAQKVGMKPNDRIVEIEGKSTLELSIDECIVLLKGKPGTDVKVTVLRHGRDKSFEVVLTRAIIKLKYVKYKMLENNIAYVRLTQFGIDVSKDVRAAVEDLRGQGMKGLIFDLRNNPGGSLGEAILVSSIFTDKDPIVTVKDKAGKEVVHNHEGRAYTDFPLVVMINEGSASASEIVSGAIRDHKRGLLLGEKSFGKGSVQHLLQFKDGSGLKLTIAKYFTPSGECIHKKGIIPDIVIAEDKDYNYFDGYVTNVSEDDKEDYKEQTKEEIKEKLEEMKKTHPEITEEDIKKLDEKEEKVDTQLKTAVGVLKGIIMSKEM